MTELSPTVNAPLSSLKPGDTVILRYSTPYIPDRIATVDRLTKTQIIVGTRRFRIGNGTEAGDGAAARWENCWIVPATLDQIAEVERRQQIKQDQERAYRLAVQIGNRARACSSAVAAIPHLVTALAVLAED